MKVRIVFEGTPEEALNILEAINKARAKQVMKKTIEKWPYWCWNCHFKIEQQPKPDERDNLICPSCGLIIPEP